MDNEKAEEFTLEVDAELRFEIETKNKKVIVEVRHFDALVYTYDFDFIGCYFF